MAVINSIMDRMVALLEGATASRSIATQRFRHLQNGLTTASQISAQRARPFVVEVTGYYEPESLPSTLCGDRIWRGATVVVSVAYHVQPANEYSLVKSIAEDHREIDRCLGYPENYSTVTGYSRSTVSDVEYSAADGNEFIILAQIPINVVYREDYES